MMLTSWGRQLREAFVELHSQPLLQDLADEFKRLHPKLPFKPPPEPGQGDNELDLNAVMDAEYFFN